MRRNFRNISLMVVLSLMLVAPVLGNPNGPPGTLAVVILSLKPAAPATVAALHPRKSSCRSLASLALTTSAKRTNLPSASNTPRMMAVASSSGMEELAHSRQARAVSQYPTNRVHFPNPNPVTLGCSMDGPQRRRWTSELSTGRQRSQRGRRTQRRRQVEHPDLHRFRTGGDRNCDR